MPNQTPASFGLHLEDAHLASNKGRFRVVEEQNGNLPDLMCTSGFCICADPAVDACAGHFGAMLPNSIRAKLIVTCLNCNLAQFQSLMIGLGLRKLCREVDHSECTGKFCLHDLPEGQFSVGHLIGKSYPQHHDGSFWMVQHIDGQLASGNGMGDTVVNLHASKIL